jgi:aspartate-semialdehyde dehydrogenase
LKPIRLAIVGATGLVGRTTLDVLTEWQIPLTSLRLFASDGSAGKMVAFNGGALPLEKLDGVPNGVDAAIFATSKQISREWAPQFTRAGVTVIDHSAEFRMNEEVPLVIPEINGDTLSAHRNLVSNPNCSASVVVLPMAALDRLLGLKTAIVDTYQSVSGSGQDALAELDAELEDGAHAPRVYPRRIAHNVFPQIGPFDEDGMCDEERKVVEELKKILGRPQMTVFTTTVRVPVRVGHSAAVTVQCERTASRGQIEAVLSAMPGMTYQANDYRTPLEIAGQQNVFVSRLRIHRDDPHWLQFWAVGDNLRKGAASNAVQILMELFKD